MDRTTCINALLAAGVTLAMATWLFHEHMAKVSECRRGLLVEHFVELAREDARLRKEERC